MQLVSIRTARNHDSTSTRSGALQYCDARRSRGQGVSALSVLNWSPLCGALRHPAISEVSHLAPVDMTTSQDWAT
jgi:hypothetical protein